MRLYLMLEPQEGLTYGDQWAVARTVESSGLRGMYRSDHYSSVAGRGGLDSTDAWAVIAGLARDTPDITLGTLVSPVTFRPVANLAKVVATAAQMAGPTPDGGPRIHLGMGTGWLEAEHRQHGFPFEDVGTRFARLEEHLAAVTGLWDPDREPYHFSGQHVQLEGAVFRPIPSPRPKIIVGGGGMRRTPALAARYADELNNVFASPARCSEQRTALTAACEELGRDPSSVGYSLMTGCLVGATTEEFRARMRRLQEQSGDNRSLGEYLGALEGEWVLGTPDQAVEHLGLLAEAGVEAVMLQHQLPRELDMIELIAKEIAPRVG